MPQEPVIIIRVGCLMYSRNLLSTKVWGTPSTIHALRAHRTVVQAEQEGLRRPGRNENLSSVEPTRYVTAETDGLLEGGGVMEQWRCCFTGQPRPS